MKKDLQQALDSLSVSLEQRFATSTSNIRNRVIILVIFQGLSMGPIPCCISSNPESSHTICMPLRQPPNIHSLLLLPYTNGLICRRPRLKNRNNNRVEDRPCHRYQRVHFYFYGIASVGPFNPRFLLPF